LRTPLNAVLGYAELIAEDAEDAGLTSVVDDVAKIRGAGQHLLGLVSEILDLTKVEAGALELTRATIVVGQLLDGVCDVVRAEVEDGGNTLVRDDRGDLGTIVGDPLRIRQLLVNLLSNAGKFTEAGVVTLRSRRDGEAIEFAVIDTGIGIDAAELARIFEPFTQVDPTSTRRYGGAGLGLTICRRLSEQMGGELAVRSELGVGSTFTLRLPVEPS
ncbi:MAG: hybrid sensor histidine kinase/response regulator, partial [Myxococcales bacterium]|nr:hybrid sensor histidine kinase/response regulator [Myxococcales bacterium]